MRAPLLAACVIAVAALLAGCGTEKKVVNSSTVKPVINKQLNQADAPPVKTIDCPEVEPKQGKTLTCQVTLVDGTAISDTIRITKVGENRPLLTIAAAKPTTLGAFNAKPLIDQQLRETHAPAAKSIECGTAPAKIGESFTCKITVAGGHVITDELRVLKVKGTTPTFNIHTVSVK